MGVNDDQRRAFGLFQRGLDGAIKLREIVDVAHVLHVPVPAEEARAYVIAEGQRGVALNGDVVVVVEPDQVGESKMPGDGGGFVAYAFHQITVAKKSETPLVKNIVAFFVELRGQPALGNCHADRIPNARAERARGGFRSRNHSVLGMSDRKSTRLNSSHLGISYAVF